MLAAGKLRHRVVLQELQEVSDSSGNYQNDQGEPNTEWVTLGTYWAAINPLSAREFIAAQSEQSKISARIVMRFNPVIDATMRLYHAAKGQYYNIEGVIADQDSGVEYITLAVSEGVRYKDQAAPPPPQFAFLYKDDGASFLFKDDGTSLLYK